VRLHSGVRLGTPEVRDIPARGTVAMPANRGPRLEAPTGPQF